MRTNLLTALLAVSVLLPTAMRAQEESRAKEAPKQEITETILLTGERLLNEEQRQNGVGRRMTSVVRRMSWLLEDLQSNELGEEGGAPTLAKTRTQLGGLRSNNVKAARDFLRAAREHLDKPHPHLDGADKEIIEIIEELKIGRASCRERV